MAMQELTLDQMDHVNGGLVVSCNLTGNKTNWASVAAWGLAGFASGGVAGLIVGAGADYLGQSWSCNIVL